MVDHTISRRNHVGAIWIVIALAFCSWVVWLAGLASVQKFCNSIQNGTGGCNHLYQFWWWVLAFELVSLLGLAATLVLGRLRSTRVMWTGLLAVLSVLKINGSDLFLFQGYNSIGQFHTRLNVTAAGFIMSSIFNLLLLIMVALNPQPADDQAVSDSAVHATKTRTVPVSTGTEGPGPQMV